MGKIPNELREIIARNIKECRLNKFPGRGGGKKCAEAFGVSPQQWSPWECGTRTPDESRLSQIADFFDVSVAWLWQDHRPRRSADNAAAPQPETPPPHPAVIAGQPIPPPPLSLNPLPPGSPASFFWLARRLVTSLETTGLRLDKQSLEYLARCLKQFLCNQ